MSESGVALSAAGAVASDRGAPRVRLIGKANGVGLSRDFDLLCAALEANGCAVTRRNCERAERKRRRGIWSRTLARARRWPPVARWRSGAALYDVNIMLEHVWPQFLHEAPCNVVVPNPEWFDRRDVAFLPSVDRIWAKTKYAEALFNDRGCSSSLIGFDSEDRYRPQIARERQFFHLAGRSPLKGTARLLALWHRHAEWPALTVVQDTAVDLGEQPSAANIVLHRGYLSDEALRSWQNSHRFHLCTSEAEGWGHYIVEAMSVRAVTLTCDAPPMNELIDTQRGLLVDGRSAGRHNLAVLCRFDDRSLEQSVERALGLSASELEAMGDTARSWFMTNKQGFVGRVARALAQLGVLADPKQARQ
jgi:hypothetical protein